MDGALTMTRSAYMAIAVMETSGCGWITALEAVASTALAHPEWDMGERKTLDQWRMGDSVRTHHTSDMLRTDCGRPLGAVATWTNSTMGPDCPDCLASI